MEIERLLIKEGDFFFITFFFTFSMGLKFPGATEKLTPEVG